MLIFDKINCCGVKIRGRVYYIDEKRYLIFADSCSHCGKPIAEIRHKNKKGEFCVNIRRTGDSAVKLLEKYYSNFVKWFSLKIIPFR